MDHVVLLLCVASVVQCYSSGLVTESCADLQPHHNDLSTQTGPVSFTVTTDRSSYRLGEEVTVQLQALSSKPFTGFLLQARQVGQQSPVGSFTLTTVAAQLLTCSQKPNSTVSHNSVSAKTSIEVAWRFEAPGDTNPIQFHASFVQNFRTFWVVKSLALTFTNVSTGGSASLTTKPQIMATAINQLAPPAHNISSAGCGVTKVCISQPSHCDPAVSADCYFMSASISPSDAAVRYEITGPSDGYISFGLSDDQAMGNVSDVIASVQGSVISCSFTSMNPISIQKASNFNSIYYIMFAHGPSNKGQIQFHADTFISFDKVDISRPRLVRLGGWPNIIKAHGSLMLIAWMTTGSLGMMVARYLKGMAKGQNLWGKDVWFLVHVVVMNLTVAATTIGFILSFSYAKDWSGEVFVQLDSCFECSGDKDFSCLEKEIVCCHTVAAIFTGLMLIDSKWLTKVMGGFVGWEALFYTLFEVHLRWKVTRTDKECIRKPSFYHA
ncbi:hypothetical protein PAMP_011524 [Pampus punctatissimus]